jgi:hypothetical protein
MGLIALIANIEFVIGFSMIKIIVKGESLGFREEL